MANELPEGYESPKVEPAKLREGERRDEDTHARRNLEQLRMAERELESDGGQEDDDVDTCDRCGLPYVEDEAETTLEGETICRRCQEQAERDAERSSRELDQGGLDRYETDGGIDVETLGAGDRLVYGDHYLELLEVDVRDRFSGEAEIRATARKHTGEEVDLRRHHLENAIAGGFDVERDDDRDQELMTDGGVDVPTRPRDDRTPCCPECTSHSITHRTGKGGASVPAHGRRYWVCTACGEVFDDPDREVPPSAADDGRRGQLSPIGRALWEAGLEDDGVEEEG